MVPLEPTYQATWDACPEELRPSRSKRGCYLSSKRSEQPADSPLALVSVPKVELKPTPSCQDRILSPARLPLL